MMPGTRRYFWKESQRDFATKPRVARDELPWVKVAGVSQPQRGLRPRCAAADVGRNPFRVVIDWACDPRVARCSQPWALLRNPFGIRQKSWRMMPVIWAVVMLAAS